MLIIPITSLQIAKLKKVGGETFDKHVTAIMQSLLSPEFQPRFNRSGKTNIIGKASGREKISFKKELEPLVIGESNSKHYQNKVLKLLRQRRENKTLSIVSSADSRVYYIHVLFFSY